MERAAVRQIPTVWCLAAGAFDASVITAASSNLLPDSSPLLVATANLIPMSAALSLSGLANVYVCQEMLVVTNNAVMPLDVLGRTRATLTEPASTSPWPKGLGNLVKLCRAGDRALQLLLFNEECLVSASHQLALTTSLPFVHTARRYYRLNGSVRPWDWLREVGNDHPEPDSCSNLVI